MGNIGFPEMLVIFVLALLIFGPKKLPELGKSLGKGLSEFRRASSELRSQFDREMQNIENETRQEETRQEEEKRREDESRLAGVAQSDHRDESNPEYRG
jgi:TatA/E family protein of Tat protein translocase